MQISASNQSGMNQSSITVRMNTCGREYYDGTNCYALRLGRSMLKVPDGCLYVAIDPLDFLRFVCAYVEPNDAKSIHFSLPASQQSQSPTSASH
jgi:hypothetical protein